MGIAKTTTFILNQSELAFVILYYVLLPALVVDIDRAFVTV